MSDDTRVTCPECKRTVPLYDSGKYPQHRMKDTPLFHRTPQDKWCPRGGTRANEQRGGR